MSPAARRRPPGPGLTLRTTAAELAADTAAGMREDALDNHIRGLMKNLRDNYGAEVLAFHPYDSRRSTGGWPDWVIAGPHGVLVRENKREGENPRADQRVWLRLLKAAGWDVDVWRPRDWLSGRIQREISQLVWGDRVPASVAATVTGEAPPGGVR